MSPFSSLVVDPAELGKLGADLRQPGAGDEKVSRAGNGGGAQAVHGAAVPIKGIAGNDVGRSGQGAVVERDLVGIGGAVVEIDFRPVDHGSIDIVRPADDIG